MRIVSQNNSLSAEMEQIKLFLQGNCISTELNGTDRVLGIYPTNERAMEVWEELHETYAGFKTPMEPEMFLYRMPKE